MYPERIRQAQREYCEKRNDHTKAEISKRIKSYYWTFENGKLIRVPRNF